jgi:hypothetical protein
VLPVSGWLPEIASNRFATVDYSIDPSSSKWNRRFTLALQIYLKLEVQLRLNFSAKAAPGSEIILRGYL